MVKKLIIWDFDGVIADTEIIWLNNRMKLVNQTFNLDWDFEKANHYLGGMSDKTKRIVLDNLGLVTDDDFWIEAIKLDIDYVSKNGFELTDGIKEIFADDKFAQCIATGGIKSKTAQKIDVVKINKWFDMDKNVFTADMVEHGKPEPDLFLLASSKMGFEPKNSIVIEDSIAGMTAAIRAGIEVIAFLGAEMYKTPEYAEKVKNLGVKHIFYTMEDIHKFLNEI